MAKLKFEFLSVQYRAYCNTHSRWLGAPKDSPEKAQMDLEKHWAIEGNEFDDATIIEITKKQALVSNIL